MSSFIGKSPSDSGSAASVSGNNARSAGKPTVPQDSSPPAKRSRKAINCQPCRSSKLKCDRARPCSSCVLRGTTSLCYPDGAPDVEKTTTPTGHPRADPQAEIQKIRQSLFLLETHFFNRSSSSKQLSETGYEGTCHPSSTSAPDTNPRYGSQNSAPAALDTRTDAGFYAGPTSSATHLFGLKQTGSLASDPPNDLGYHLRGMNGLYMVQEEEDEELTSRLPTFHIVDRVLHFYVSNCSTMNLFVQKTPLITSWERYKNGEGRTRLTLSLVFVVIAVAIQFLPPHDELFLYLRRDHVGSIAELSDWFYEQSCQALALHESVSTMPSLELVEVFLVQINYLSISKNHAEEVWRLRGTVVSSAIALGLHRDPNKWNMPHPLAERRRWAWFNVLRVERWLAFMLGRPTVFSNNHFDCLFPSSADPGGSEKDMDHLPFIHMFRLMILYGDIMNDLVSVKPVPYETIVAHDRALEEWMTTFPPGLRLDPNQLSQVFRGTDPVKRDQGVQTMCLRLAGLHARLALHRPYAAKSFPAPAQSVDDSLRIATEASTAIIHLVSACRQNYLSNPVLTVPGHIHWGVLHHFAALIFLTFQIISQSDQRNAEALQALISSGLLDLEALRGIPAADKAITIIHALQPLYSPEAGDRDVNLGGGREHILKAAMRLPIPFVDSPGQRCQRIHRAISPPSMSPVAHSHSTAAPLLHNYTQETAQAFANLQMGIYDQTGPILPTQIPSNRRDDTYWSSAVGVETNDWTRFMQEVLPKTEYPGGS